VSDRGAGHIDAFEALTSAPPAPTRQPGNRVAQPAKKRRREAVKVDPDQLAEIRHAVLFLRGHGRPEVSMADLLDEALGQYLDTLRQTHGVDRFEAPGDPDTG
jgi:hypothetical protein